MPEFDMQCFFDRVASYKMRTRAMIEEFKGLPIDSRHLFAPSNYWTTSIENFRYLWALPEEHFLRLDVHLFHFTGLTPYVYLSDRNEEFRLLSGIDQLCRDLPIEYVINEPIGNTAFEYNDGRRLTWDTVRRQRIIWSLYHAGALTAPSSAPQNRRIILEIGAGYGGLAYHLSRIVGDTTYIIVDLPESLLFSSSYLSLHAPDKKLFLYDPDDQPNKPLVELLRGDYDFILLPNYRLSLIADLHTDLVINIASMQEMRTDQVAAYLDFIQSTKPTAFYSRNKDRQPGNVELVNLSDMIKARFNVQELKQQEPDAPRSTLKALARDLLPPIAWRSARSVLEKLGLRAVFGLRLSQRTTHEYIARHL